MKKILIWLMAFILIVPVSVFAEESTDVSEGDIVLFGQYDQDGNPDNGPEPLQWLVLEVDDDSLLLITEYEIACQSYCSVQDQPSSWEDSDLRAWLNGFFLSAAFSAEEQEAILQTPLYTQGHQRQMFRMGKRVEFEIPESNTIDSVFVLSSEEVERYFSFSSSSEDAASENRLSMPTYGVLLKLIMQGMTSLYSVMDIPAIEEYSQIAGKKYPLAEMKEGKWTLRIPSLNDYSQFWKDIESFNTFNNVELWPYLLREQGMIYDCYMDGLGSTGFYGWYCWDSICVRPVVRVNRTALEQGIIIQPAVIYPSAADPELVGVWKANIDDYTEYYVFDTDGYHLQVSTDLDVEHNSVDCRYAIVHMGSNLIMTQIGSQGQLLEIRYRVSGDTLSMSFNGEEIEMERSDYSELPK